MTTRILPAVGDPDAARAIITLLSQLPDAEPASPAPDSTSLLDTLARLAQESLDELPEVVLVHERIGPVPALEVIREVALRFPAVGVVLISADTSPQLFTAAMDSGARGMIGLPLSYEELAGRVQNAASWSVGVRRHLGAGADVFSGPGGTVVTVTGAKGGMGTTLISVQLALAAKASGRTVALVDLDLQSGDLASYLDVQFRRSIADLAGISDITPRVLQDALYTHATGLGLLLAPVDGERGEEVTDRVARQVVSALRNRYEIVVVDCGTQMNSANAAAIEMADQAVLVVTPDVIAVRAAKRMVRLWDRLQIRKAEETTTVVNRLTRNTEIQPPLVEKITGTKIARSSVPSNYKELQSAADAGRLQDLEARSTVKQAIWALAGELGLVKTQENASGGRGGRARGDRGLVGRSRRGDKGAISAELAGMFPLILLVMVLMWQAVVWGYTFSLAGNAADEGARKGTAAYGAGGSGVAECEAAIRSRLPGAWAVTESHCGAEGNLYKATVKLNVPVLFPGANAFNWSSEGKAGAALEGAEK
ncbi:septum formation initiator [Streptomyces spiroverticillatus]|uniref:Septum formation initiator n=1 Tax=Streptomyces finlayi TaxID=67296 RepID=A0A919C716_9ACTN|nr:AAA family ATPase [Streptomyces finlayi]GGZ86711.1 septum formation initiator [Streptomyces spiroverticillatus]GHC78199.1 septum formation initiator [Streptomyces finlayi]